MNDIDNCIIFCGDGFNALGLVRSLGKVGFSPDLILLKEQKSTSIVSRSKYVGSIIYSESYDEALDVLITQYGNSIEKKFLFATDDVAIEYLNAHFLELRDKFFFYHCGSHGDLSYLLNKDYQCSVAESSGIRVPDREIVNKGQLPERVSYPIITKTVTSNEGAWKQDMFICRTESELLSKYNEIKADRVLLEEYVEKKDELEFHGISIENGMYVYIPYVSSNYRFSDISYGRYKMFKPFDNSELFDKLHQFLMAIQYNGIFCIEFLVDKHDQLFFLEINTRTGMSHSALRAVGINLPLKWIQFSKAKIIPTQDNNERNQFDFIDELGDYAQSVSSGKITGFRWLIDVVKSDSRMLFDIRDIRPVLFVLYGKLYRFVKKMIS